MGQSRGAITPQAARDDVRKPRNAVVGGQELRWSVLVRGSRGGREILKAFGVLRKGFILREGKDLDCHKDHDRKGRDG